MDIIQDWGNLLLAQFTPSTINTIYNYTLSFRNYLLAFLDVLTTSQPSLTTIALTLVLLLISLKIFSYIINAVLFWVYFFVKLAFWCGVILFGAWVWQRGPEGVVEDVQGFVNRWTGEYEKQKEKVEYTKAFYDQVGRGAPGGRAVREGWWR